MGRLFEHHRVQAAIKKLAALWRELIPLWNESAVRLLPGHIAFFTMLSIVPISIILFFGAQYFSLSLEPVIGPIRMVLPDAVSALLSPVEEQASASGIGVWILVALFVGSNGLYALMVGSNSLYDFESNNYVLGRFKALLLTVLMVVFVLIGVAVIGFSEYLSAVLSGGLQTVITFVRWVLIGLLAFAVVKYVYIVTPRKRIPSRFTNAGTIMTVLGWLIATMAYSFYHASFSNYGAIYGGLTDIIVTMIWVYIMATIFVGGLLINVCQYREDTRKRRREAEEVETDRIVVGKLDVEAFE